LRLKKPIDAAELVKLKRSGWSSHRLAQHYKVSKATIKRRLREEMPKDKTYTDFANKLAEIAKDAPAGYCQDELRRLVNNIRTLRMLSEEEKQQRVLHSLATGAREVEEIAEDCNFNREETVGVLKHLLTEKKVICKQRGGTLNRGRKMKFHFFPVKEFAAAAAV
jgi:hypothetical protein